MKTFATLANTMNSLRAHGEDLTLQGAEVFFLIAFRPGLTAQELMDRTGLSQSSISRNLTALSEWNRKHKPGMHWVDTVEDPRERRRKISFLTDEGKRVALSLVRAFDPEFDFAYPVTKQEAYRKFF